MLFLALSLFIIGIITLTAYIAIELDIGLETGHSYKIIAIYYGTLITILFIMLWLYTAIK